MRVGIIGCGSIGARHARNLVALGHQPDLLVDADRDRAQGLAADLIRAGAKCHIASGPSLSGWNWNGTTTTADAVLICTPAETHASVAGELLALGYKGPLFVEKPIATRLDECDVFRSWPHPTTMVGYNLRFQPHAQILKGCATLCGSFVLRCDMRAWPGDAYGLPLLECSHELDLALWCGAPPRVSRASRLVNGETGEEFRIELTLGHYTVSVDWQSDRYYRSWSGSDGHQGYHWGCASPDELGVRMYKIELEQFLACADGNARTVTPFDDGIRVIEVVEQTYRAFACVS